jgi:hypothetical protein
VLHPVQPQCLASCLKQPQELQQERLNVVGERLNEVGERLLQLWALSHPRQQQVPVLWLILLRLLLLLLLFCLLLLEKEVVSLGPANYQGN